MLDAVMTVTGPIAPDELGVVLPHEHVFTELVREFRADGLLTDAPLAAAELRLYAAAGGTTLMTHAQHTRFN